MIILICAFFFITSCANLKYLDAFNGYLGKPKKVVEKHYLIGNLIGNDDNDEKTFSFGDSYQFDKKGRIVVHQSFEENASDSLERWLYEYDKYGNRTKLTELNPNGDVDFTSSASYNNRGQRIFQKSYIAGEKDTTFTLSLIDRKKFTILKIIKDNTVPRDCTFISYNKDWKPLKTEYLNNTLTSKVEYRYDDIGNSIERRSYKYARGLSQINKSRYNSKNHIISSDRYDIIKGDTILTASVKWTYVYDQKGNPIEEKRFDNDKLKWFTTFEYSYE